MGEHPAPALESMPQDHNGSGDGHGEHIASARSYFAVWGALMILTVVTVGASLVHLGAFNVPIALAIATVKAALVALFFMHLIYDDKFNLVVLVTGMIFVVIFFALTVSDMLFRGAIDPREQRDIAPPAAVVQTPAAPVPAKH